MGRILKFMFLVFVWSAVLALVGGGAYHRPPVFKEDFELGIGV